MRRALLALSLLAVILLAVTFRSRPRVRPRALIVSPEMVYAPYWRRVDSLERSLQTLLALPHPPNPREAQDAFRRVRAAYKRIEFAVEFDDAYRAAILNGPPLPRPDEDDPASVLPPTGLQVIESVLFPKPAAGWRMVVGSQVKILKTTLEQIRSASPDTIDIVRRPFDMARAEVARIATLGIAGFDATVSKDGLRESAEAFRGVAEALQIYEPAMRSRDSSGWEALQSALSSAVKHLEASADFERFDRFTFLTQFVRPITEGLDRLQRALKLPRATRPTPWSAGATDIYAAGALAPGYFSPDFAPPSTAQLIALGERLFFDRSLSLRRQRSCATCHQPSRAFTDGRTQASVDHGPGVVRNTPTLLHAGMQGAQFADQRVRFLELQAEAVLGNPREMGLPLALAVARLRSDPDLSAQFGAAFGKRPPEAITEQTLMIAIAAYVRSLGRADSRFDRAIRGDTGAISPAERRGFNLFMGKGGCATCHFPPLFNGTQPPRYQETEPEVIGVPANPPGRPASLDRDLGVFAIYHAELHRHAFKTPTVRNVAVTGPYMHNGVFRTLDQVVDFYDRGGGIGLGLHVPNQTLSSQRLRLTKQEKLDLIEFLGSLTDSAYDKRASSRISSRE